MKLITFLRGINTLGRNVTMDYLRTGVRGGGLRERRDAHQQRATSSLTAMTRTFASLERAIEHMLVDALGYDVATFIRTDAELRAVARHKPFMPATLKNAVSLNVAFVGQPLDAKATQAIMALKTNADQFSCARP